MLRLVVFFLVLLLLAVLMWENIDQTASLSAFGQEICRDVPVLLLLFSAMLIGMLLTIPFGWAHAISRVRRVRTRLQGRDKAKAAALEQDSEHGSR
jgi:uncharacterized integral membrane protein